VCFVVRKTISEQEHTILTALYLAGAKNTDTMLVARGEAMKAVVIVEVVGVLF
jgi:hypothetical protein